MKRVTRNQLNQHWVRWLAAAWLGGVLACAGAQEPELNVLKEDKSVRIGEKYRIECEVSWPGDPGDYAVLAAEVDPIEWGTAEVLSSQATVRDGRNVVTQTIEIAANEPGEYETPEITIAYLRPEESAPPEDPSSRTNPDTRSAYPPLRVAPFTLHVDPGRANTLTSGGLLGAILLLLALAAGTALLRRSRARIEPAVAGGFRYDSAATESAIESAARLRLNGDHYGFYQALARAAAVLGDPAAELKERLEKRAADAGYRGTRPTDDEMDADVRALRRAMTELRERGAS